MLRMQFYKEYDQLLNSYMSKDAGVGQDLTLVRACMLDNGDHSKMHMCVPIASHKRRLLRRICARQRATT